MTKEAIVLAQTGVPITLASKDGSAVSLKSVHVGAGWNTSRSPTTVDIDLMVLMLADSKNKTVVTQSNGDEGLIYYARKKSACGSINLDKDNRTGEGDGYDENTNINLETIPENVNCLAVCIDIYQAKQKSQNFGIVENAFIDVNVAGIDSIKVDLSEDYSQYTAVHIADIYRVNGEWKVKKIGLGSNDGVQGIVAGYRK